MKGSKQLSILAFAIKKSKEAEKDLEDNTKIENPDRSYIALN